MLATSRTAGASPREVAMAAFMQRMPADAFDVTCRSLMALIMACGKLTTNKDDPEPSSGADTACVYALEGLNWLRRVRPDYTFIEPMLPSRLPHDLSLNVDRAAHLAYAQGAFDEAVDVLVEYYGNQPRLQELAGVRFATHNDITGRRIVMSAAEELYHSFFDNGDGTEQIH